ncbi:1-deoxy-D-xylulose-5-phosphate reductoisomerase [Pseudovibrio exalbescens]|uniref:1-deoxy-D-xylulose-5-phosphate reductoisomerase n=1 Tax=Pseudovibrio exalbescens TaxID=197461 RepID=UPI00236739F4|nr:1-deoxy-D-xylulose-5-phosphate reductoisomerase [Pseudovibrio exalbescens]MDD7908581.1 1-deoxy-D-xylulose-5-phosphate reductoisomerase [Pseudovibrio exalbescens]
MSRQKIAVLGATGSIGQSTLDLISRNPESYEVGLLVANSNAQALADAALAVNAQHVVINDESKFAELKARLDGSGIGVAAGRQAVLDWCREPFDMLVSAMVGAAGLEPTYSAINAGSNVALANKESLVCAGRLVRGAVQKAGTALLPVDSEHNAIFQVFEHDNADQIEKIIVTASGGPFRTASFETMKKAGPAEALRHPNWEMGSRITIDSATMMNKAFEVIESLHLFPVETRQIEVLVHPQSLVHGMVQYSDGSLLAQMGPADMRVPIAHCLAYPKRMPVEGQRLDLATIGQLTFERPDSERFPSMRLVWDVIEQGDGAGTAFNGADEVAVAAFLKEEIGFLDIVGVVEDTLVRLNGQGLLAQPSTLADVLHIDGEARRVAREFIEAL